LRWCASAKANQRVVDTESKLIKTAGQNGRHVGMAMLNNAAKSGRVMLTDIAEIMTFRRQR